MKLAITVGLPCSGKSMFCEWLNKAEGHIIVSANALKKTMFGEQDDYFQSPLSDLYIQATAQTMVRHYLQLGYSVIVDAENLTRDQRKVWCQIAKDYHLYLAVYWANTPLSTCYRINELYGNIPRKVLEHKADILEYPIYKESKNIKWIHLPRMVLENDELRFTGKLSKL